MELATNNFVKGLQMDTNPMVLSNDTLTDCLNGTIITMNGNEPILLNDMGNRRVDRAFLPAGYEPVGIKEYGGIIYIAAYNPITNKSLIGSFPSPEKRINSSNENQKSIDISFGNEDILSDTLMFPLTENNLLHAGDKFVVYGYLPDSIKENLTNYNNITGDKITSPKNKCYTLSLGILNSLNEFVDITKTLVRWEILDDQSIIDPTIIDTRNLSDEIKFNTGYFIPEMYKPTEIDESINDLKFIKERLAMPANTYSYKLVGPLYLKAKLNHIEEFDYNIYGEKNGQNLILYVEALITYNCPDWLDTDPRQIKGNSKYYDLGEYQPLIEEELASSGKWFILEHNESHYFGTVLSGLKPRYDENLNTYSIKLIKEFKTSFSGDIFTGKLKIKTNSVYNAFWKPLELDIYIDVSKLGSGSVELKGWRFTSSLENQISTLVYNFEAYPRYGEIYNDVELKFTDVSDRNSSATIYGRLNNGKTTLSIDWNKLGLLRRRLYQVDIKVTSNKLDEPFAFTRWFLTTELMNNCFSASNDDFINDYGNPIGNEESILTNKLTVKVSPDLIIEDNSIVNYDKNNIEGIKKSPGEFNVALNHKYIFNIDLKLNLNIINENLYPDYILVNLTNNPDINITELNFDSENTSIRESCLSMGEKAFGQTTKFIEIQNPISITGNNLSGVIKFSDKFLSNSVSPTDLNIKNPFSYVKTHFIETVGSERLIFGRREAFLLPKFGGISISYKTRTGPDDYHYLLGYFNTDPYGMVASEENRTEISKEKNDGEITFSYLKSASDMEDYLNSVFSDPQNIFILHFRYNDNRQYSVYYKDNKDDDLQSRDDSNYMKARVWWRTAQGGWGLCYTLFNKPLQPSQFKNDFKEYIKNLFGGRYDTLVYCIKDLMSCSEAGVYVPDSENYTYNNKYSIDKNLNIVNKVKYTLGNNNPEIEINETQKIIKFYPVNNVEIEKSFDIPFSFKSNDNFLDKADSLVNNIQLENIDIEHCKSVDTNGNKLNPLNVYNYFSSAGGYLVKLDMNLTVTNLFGNGKYNTLLIKNPKPGTPLFRYDFTFTPDSDHSRTYIDYSGFNVISSPYN